VLADLERSIRTDIAADRSFNIIFFSGRDTNAAIGAQRGVACLFPSLRPGSPANISAAAQWILKAETGGSGDPLAALKTGLDMDPNMIYILSDNITGSGVWEVNQNAFMAEFHKARLATEQKTKKRILFKTIQFVYPDPLEKIGMEPTLRRIVKETSGNADKNYKFISAANLGLR